MLKTKIQKKKFNHKMLRHMNKLYKIHGNIGIPQFWSAKYKKQLTDQNFLGKHSIFSTQFYFVQK